MELDTLLDYASFQLSPKRTRCDLFVTTDGKTEKLASGLVKPFISHLKFAEEQVASAASFIKLEVEGQRSVKSWFTKGTLDRFVRFVNTPEVMELVNTYDAELSQLESARRIYSQDVGDRGLSDNGVSSDTAAADATKKELLKAIDVRLSAVQQDLITASSRATAAGFNLDTVAKLQSFSAQFGAYRLNEACSKFISLCKKRPHLINQWKPGGADEHAVRSSYGSDMSLDEDPPTPEQQCTMFRPISQNQDAVHQQSRPHLDQSRSFSNQSLKPSSVVFQSGKKDLDETQETPMSRNIRRLSVQDRINMFENKQKETSGSGGKPITGKSVELRRMSSDVLVSPPVVAEKTVLRRWSGVSDMSIDLSSEKKDGESPLCTTPSSACVIKSKPEDEAKSDQGKSFNKMEFQSVPDRAGDIRVKEHEDLKLHNQYFNEKEESKLPTASHKKVEASESSNSKSYNSTTVESNGQKDKTGEKPKSILYSTRPANSLKEIPESQGMPASLPWDNKTRKVGVTNKGKSTFSLGSDGTIEPHKTEVHASHVTALKDENSSPEQFGASTRQASYDDATHHIVHHSHEETPSRDELAVSKSRLKAPKKTKWDFGPLESGSLSRAFLNPQGKGFEGDPFNPQYRSQSSAETEKEKVDLAEKVDVNSGKVVNSAGFPIMKSKKQVVGADVKNNSQDCIEEMSSVSININRSSSAEMVAEAQEGSMSIFSTPVQQVQRVRLSKGNQELNDELKIKANELEKLFAEHKQSNPARKNKPTEIPASQQANSLHTGPAADSTSFQYPDKNSVTGAAVTSSSGLVNIDNKGCTDVLSKSVSELCASEGSRGKSYATYMRIRDAKLRKEWNSKRNEKEAKLKAMHESLEKTRAKMKAKFSGCSYTEGSVSTLHRRAERLKAFDSRSILRREKQHLDFDQHEDEGMTKFAEENQYEEGRYPSETSDAFLEDDASTGSQAQKPLPAKASTRPAIKGTINSNPGRRKSQSENPLAQSVPNFSDMRIETAKISSAVGQTARSQLKNYARNKHNSEDEMAVKEDKSWRSQLLRNSTINQGEFGEASILDSEDVLTLKIDKIIDKVRNNVDSRTFHSKGKSASDSGTRVGVPKQRRFIGSQNTQSDGEYNDGVVHLSNSPIKDGEDMLEDTEHISNIGNMDSILSHESEKSSDFGSESGGDLVRSFSHFNPVLASEFTPSMLDSAEQLQDGQSPVSWNSHAPHQFSYSNEMSDLDAYVDSPPAESLASWNSHSLSQTESDAARMRKKWGTVQKPLLVSTSSNNQPRKDMTRGFKRLLKFGRKTRGAESSVDWISATTSEGDDDTEDGREPANRLSDDMMKKSRMGVLQRHPSDDNFNEHEFFAEQVQTVRGSIPAPPANFKLRDDHLSGSSSLKAPRSFFSLPNFRNKANDSKIR
ncbi:unnamed protein product [Cuscuta epithymum]|uniref:COP1-interacting protein 7 n=1 Tax=Cuscuta epithymum TaxID=186058 RepID=A0AAV0BZP3_9ASTE|nr:unnamed protein product [Cuscuta epithymum]